ncbi:hypothetical protein ACFLRF_06090, partial [Candidatus Altiarchaeota archaeon]
DIGPGLTEYERNLNMIIDIAESRSVRVILVTQPHMFDPFLPESEKSIFIWCGTNKDDPSRKCFSTSVWNETLTAFNEVTLRVCRDRGVDCIDMEGAIPKNSTYFTDGIHFTEVGSRLFADRMYDQLKDLPPVCGK